MNFLFTFSIFILFGAILQAPSAFAADAGITISAVGDVMMGTNYPNNTLPPNDGKDLFKFSPEYIKAADIRFGNLEDTLLDDTTVLNTKAGGKNRWLFRTPTIFAANLENAGFNVMSLANNHSKDFGVAGLTSTKQNLMAHKIQYSSKDGEVAVFNIRGISVALIATDFYAGHRSVTTPDSTLKEIAALKQKYKIVIVSSHIGGEGHDALHVLPRTEVFLNENRGNSIAFAHAAINSGADLILMHGPHVPRAMELYGNKLIIYSLGNFVTSRGISIQDVNGLAPLVRVHLDQNGNFLKGHIASFVQSINGGVSYDRTLKARSLIENLSRTDFPNSKLGFSDDGFITPLVQ